MAQDRTVQTPVGPLAVRLGEGGPRQPVAVLWHSLFVDDRSWSRVESDLSRERRLLLITGPGHGASGDPGRRYSMQDCAAAATVVLEEMGIQEPVDWVGNAWGGHVGIVFAATWPSQCRTLVTVGTPIHAYSWKGRAETQLLLQAYRVLGPARFLTNAITEALLSASTRDHDPEAVQLVGDSFTSANRARLSNAVVSISLQRQDLTESLPKIAAPTLFVTGGEHPEWTPQLARDASRLLRNGSAAAVDKAAYLVPLEAPKEFGALVRQFWAANASRPAPA
ncbi:MAG TPA: alpha/beta hydrolase [Nocardioidaceae bacterium]|nr:alpha/beta hydrolase [Nocardioidaceae bacterium]